MKTQVLLKESIISAQLSLKYQDQNIAKSFVTKVMRTARDMHNNESNPFDGYSIDESIELILNLVSSLVDMCG